MKKLRPIATLADLVVLAAVVMLNPLNALLRTPPPLRIPDKVEIRYLRETTADSTTMALLTAEMDEMDYYLRSHNVTDEGYNLVAQYNNQLQQERRQQKKAMTAVPQGSVYRLIKAKDRPMTAVKAMGGYWKAGHFIVGPLKGQGITRDSLGRIVSGLWACDTIVLAFRYDSTGIYQGQMNRQLQACGQGVMDQWDGCHKEGFWLNDILHGFAFDSSPHHPLHVGEWKEGRFLGERIKYTTERIYGIDISRHQHEKGRQRFAINWRKLRITSLGKRHPTEGRTFPVSFIYIKSTEGTTIRNRYFVSDYAKAKKEGIHVGAYHFFSLSSTAEAQANYFVNHTLLRKGDFPPVLDVEPSEAQIRKIGEQELMRRIRVWMQIVERRSGMRPILYVSQMFINQHMKDAADIKRKYNVWIARYGQYKPDVRLVYWQLCADGRVEGINGPVDINVFNGYQGQFDEFVRTGFHK